MIGAKECSGFTWEYAGRYFYGTNLDFSWQSTAGLIEPQLLDGGIQMGCRNMRAALIERGELLFQSSKDV